MAELPKVSYPRKGYPDKVLTPSSQSELEALLRIGWKKIDDSTKGA